MKKLVSLIFFLIFLFPSWAFPAGEVFLRAYKDKVIDAATINATAEVCSVALSVSRVEYLSVQWNAVSATGAANVRVYVTASIDETNFVTP